MESGPLCFQKTVREVVMAWHKREQMEKREIWPARQVLPNEANISEDDMEFCASLACETEKDGLVW